MSVIVITAVVLPLWWNGRHGRLKICCPQGREGSSPSEGTRLIAIFYSKNMKSWLAFSKNKKLYFSLFSSFCCLFFQPTAKADIYQPLVNEVKDLIQKKYIVEGVSDEQMTDGAVDGMLRGLDPYSSYFNEEEYQNFKNNTDGKFCGIGVEMVVDINTECPIVTNVFADSPADNAGIIIGDIITHVNNIPINGMKQNAVAKMIKGPKGSPVKLTLFRQTTNETFSLTMNRNEVKIPNIVSKIYKNKTAIMEIKLFNHQTYNDFVSQLNDIRRQYDISGLIIDLRNNPGGLLESAVDIANLFLKDGQLITSVKGRNGVKVFDYVARNKLSVLDDLKIAVLINKGSASASEILAGCLQDYGIAKLIGEQTFGKALVQEIFQLSSSKGVVKMTTGQYHTPKDKPINGIGIEPDIYIQEKRTKKYDAILQGGINYINQN